MSSSTINAPNGTFIYNQPMIQHHYHHASQTGPFGPQPQQQMHHLPAPLQYQSHPSHLSQHNPLPGFNMQPIPPPLHPVLRGRILVSTNPRPPTSTSVKCKKNTGAHWVEPNELLDDPSKPKGCRNKKRNKCSDCRLDERNERERKRREQVQLGTYECKRCHKRIDSKFFLRCPELPESAQNKRRLDCHECKQKINAALVKKKNGGTGSSEMDVERPNNHSASPNSGGSLGIFPSIPSIPDNSSHRKPSKRRHDAISNVNPTGVGPSENMGLASSRTSYAYPARFDNRQPAPMYGMLGNLNGVNTERVPNSQLMAPRAQPQYAPQIYAPAAEFGGLQHPAAVGNMAEDWQQFGNQYQAAVGNMAEDWQQIPYQQPVPSGRTPENFPSEANQPNYPNSVNWSPSDNLTPNAPNLPMDNPTMAGLYNDSNTANQFNGSDLVYAEEDFVGAGDGLDDWVQRSGLFQ